MGQKPPVNTYVHTYVFIHTYVYTYIRVCIHVCECVCAYMHVLEGGEEAGECDRTPALSVDSDRHLQVLDPGALLLSGQTSQRFFSAGEYGNLHTEPCSGSF